MKNHQCSRCEYVFEEARPRAGALGSLSRSRIGLEQVTRITCPRCGNHGPASPRKFFGVLAPRGMQRLFVAVWLTAIGAAAYRTLEVL